MHALRTPTCTVALVAAFLAVACGNTDTDTGAATAARLAAAASGPSLTGISPTWFAPYDAGTVSTPFTVQAEAVVALDASAWMVPAGGTVRLPATVTPAGAPIAQGGTVRFFDEQGDFGVNDVATDARGVATFTTPPLTTGGHHLYAAFSGLATIGVGQEQSALVVVLPAEGDTTADLTLSPGHAQFFPGGAPVAIDPGLTVVSAAPLDAARVVVTAGYVAGQDVLAFPGHPGISGAFDPATGVLSLSGPAPAADYQAALRSVTYANTAGLGADLSQRQVAFSLGANLPLAATGHTYLYLPASGIPWAHAKVVAEAWHELGRGGYLATVTSAAESAFIRSRLAGTAWVGARTESFGLPRTWSWATGPEAGTPFFTQTADVATAGHGGGVPIAGRYANWAAGEPNDRGGVENAAHVYPLDGTWNDRAEDSGAVDGLVIEFGDQPGDPATHLSGVRRLDLGAITFALAFETDGTPGATLTGAASQGLAPGGDATPVTAVPPATHYFTGWTGTGGLSSSDNPLTVLGVTADLVIVAHFAEKAAQAITFAPPAAGTYGDAAIDLARYARGGDSGEPVTFGLKSGPATLSAGRLTFTRAGTVVVTASQAGSATFLAAASVDATIEVGKATAGVVLGDLAAVYDGTAHAATATTDPPGLTVTFTYDGAPTAPTAVGVYAVGAAVSDDRYQGAADGTLRIDKGTATVHLAGLTAAYDGAPHAATATTDPPGLAVTFTYDGGATAPTAVGSYAVHATVVDDRYRGAADGTLRVDKGTATVTLANLSATYDGAPHAAAATTDPPGLAVTLTYDGDATAPTTIGSYAVHAAVVDDRYNGAADGSLVIAPPPAQVVVHSSRATSRHGRPIVFTAAVTGGGAPATGTVTFKTGETVLGTAGLSGGEASVTVRSLTRRSTPWPITAEYGGSSTLAPATGTLEGGQSVENSPPVPGSGSALTFGPAAAATARLPLDGALDGAAFTLEVWLRPTWSVPAAADAAEPTVLALGDGGTPRLAVGVAPDRSALRVAFAGQTRVVPAPLDGPAWHHLGLVYQDGALQVLVDGALADTVPGVPAGTGAALVLGAAFTGDLDEVRAWSVARSAAAITADLRRPLGGGEAGLVGYWRLDDGDGTEPLDDGPGHRDGAVTLAAQNAHAFAPSTAWSHRELGQDHAMAPAAAGYDPDGDALTLAVTTAAQHGTGSADAHALQVGYRPAARYLGPDTLGFSLDDGSGPVSYTLELDVARVLVCHASDDCGGGDTCVNGSCTPSQPGSGGGGGCGPRSDGSGWALLVALLALAPRLRRRDTRVA